MATVENQIFGGPIKYDVAKKITEQMQKNIFRIKLYLKSINYKYIKRKKS